MIKYFYTKKQKKFITLYNRQQRGFSLIEMMVVVVILGLIVLGLVTFFTGGTKSWVAGQSQLEAQRNARQAMDRMVKKIREGKNVKLGSNGTTITIIYTDSSEKEYRKDGSTLREDGSPLIDNLIEKDYNENPIFEYYEKNGEVPTTPSGNNVSKVHIELEVDVDKDNNPDITLNTDVNLRNYSL
ncbi:prepilin-type N-terminal cleavage/methylation domain-containing protein [bacterium]|nr:prepilin-type N-terminal cleavage/methylation domain-containing protein [bacterium]